MTATAVRARHVAHPTNDGQWVVSTCRPDGHYQQHVGYYRQRRTGLHLIGRTRTAHTATWTVQTINPDGTLNICPA